MAPIRFEGLGKKDCGYVDTEQQCKNNCMGKVGLQGVGRGKSVVEVAFGIVVASLHGHFSDVTGVIIQEGYWCHLCELSYTQRQQQVSKQDWSLHADSHLVSSSHSTALSAWMTNHQLVLPVSAA